MAIEIVSFPIKHGDFPLFFLCLPEGISPPNDELVTWGGSNVPRRSGGWATLQTNPARLSHAPGRPKVGFRVFSSPVRCRDVLHQGTLILNGTLW